MFKRLILTLIVAFLFWATISFISQDMMWWYDNWIGRIVAVIIVWRMIMIEPEF